MNSHAADDRPALLGGAPIRPCGPPGWPRADPLVAAVLERLAADGAWGRYHGAECERLKEALQSLHACRHLHLCCSGTAAVEIALRALQIGPGDEVLLAAYDFKANFTNVLHVGARPVLVDVREDDWQLDIDGLEAALRPEVKGVIASHLQGGLVDMPRLREWADRRGVALIEDACQATGALVQGRIAGQWGDLGVLSFGGSKLLTAGRGGALMTNRDDLAQRMRLITQRGNDAYPLSEMQAAVLLPQCERLIDDNLRRTSAVQRIGELLGDAGLTPLFKEGADRPAFYKLGWRYDPARFDDLPRDRFAEAMRAEGIAVDPGFRGLHRIHASSRFRTAGRLPAAEAADAGMLTLHHPVLLGTEEDFQQIAAAVTRIRRHARALKEM